MSLAEKLSALRRFFGTPTQLELLPAVAAMNAVMGILGEGALPAQVDALIAATGIEVRARLRMRGRGQLCVLVCGGWGLDSVS